MAAPEVLQYLYRHMSSQEELIRDLRRSPLVLLVPLSHPTRGFPSQVQDLHQECFAQLGGTELVALALV